VIKESRMMVDADSQDREKFNDRVQIESDKRSRMMVDAYSKDKRKGQR